MRTEIGNGRLVVRDNPTSFWLFYSFFIMGGSTALYLSLSAVPQGFAESLWRRMRIEDLSLSLRLCSDRLQSSILSFERETDRLMVLG